MPDERDIRPKWRAELLAAFSEGGTPYLGFSTNSGYAALVEHTLHRKPVTSEELERFLAAVVSWKDRLSDPSDIQGRALRQAGLAFLLIEMPRAEDMLLIDEGNAHEHPNGVTLASKVFRDTWAQIRYKRTLRPRENRAYGEKQGRKRRPQAAAAIVDAIQSALDGFESFEAYFREGGGANDQADESDVRKTMRQLAWQLDRAPSFYPPALRPSVLARSMSAGKLHDHAGDEFITLEAGLYQRSRAASRRAESALRSVEKLDRVVVLGDPGGGKTTLLAAHIVDRISEDEDNVALFVRASDLARLGAGSRPRSAADACELTLDAFADWADFRLEDFQRAALVEQLSSGNVTLGIDGLDEVQDSAGRAIAMDAIVFLDSLGGRIIITSRFTGYEKPLDNVEELVLDQLSDWAAESFIDAWYQDAGNGEGRARALDAMEKSREVRDLVHIPVMAGLVAFVAETDDVPQKAALLYERYIALFLERRWKPRGERRVRATQIQPLITAATELAWKMATDGAGAADQLGCWSDLVTGAALAEIAPDHSSEISDLTWIDGLLTLHGSPDPHRALVHENYRWLHRTVQEHLVGVGLARRLSSRANSAFGLLEAAAQSPNTWNVALQHTMQSLGAPDQDRVLETLLSLSSRGDPGEVIQTALYGLAQLADPASLARGRVVTRALDAHDWSPALLLDPVRTRSVLQRLPDSDDQLGSVKRVLWELEANLVPEDRDFVERLCDWYRDRDDSGFRTALGVLGKFDSDRAASLAFEATAERPGFDGSLFSENASAELAQRVAAAARALPFPTNVNMVLLASRIASRFPSPTDLRTSVPLRLAMLAKGLVEADSNGAPLEWTETARAAVQGQHGPWAAYLVAQAYPGALTGVLPTDWAQVANRLRRDRPPAAAPDLTRSEALHIVRAFTDHFDQPAKVVGLIRAVDSLADATTLDEARALLHLHDRIPWPAPSDLDAEWTPLPDVTTSLRRLLVARIVAIPVPVLLPALISSAESADEFSSGLRIIGDALRLSRSEELDEALVDFVAHRPRGSRVNIWILARPYDPVRTVRRLMERVPVEQLSNHYNVRAMALWLSEVGQLHMWRERLLDLEAAGDS